MLELHSWTTPNGDKLHIMLEELGLPHRVVPVNLGAGEQNTPEYRAINPNGKIPALIDPEGPDGEPIVVFESGAILVYLGEKTGKFLPADTRGRFAVLQWLMFQMSAVGPQLGLLFRARNAAEPVPEQVERFTAEVARIYGVVERQLASGGPFLAGAYSIADIACFPWMRNHKALGLDIAQYPKVRAWLDEIAARPAVQRGMQVLRTPRA
jgi:GST-like protein